MDVVDVVNQGLRDAGLPLRIADIYEGSEAAKVALEIFTQSRDEILRLTDWSFSRKVMTLGLLKGPPPPGGYSPSTPWSNLYPNPGFLYEYRYPGDCLDLRAVIAPPGLMPDLDPVPQLWRIDDDPTPNIVDGSATGPATKVILCNLNRAIGVYRAQITDPNEWDSGFIAALVASLGEKFATAFGADTNAAREQKTEAIVARNTNSDVRG